MDKARFLNKFLRSKDKWYRYAIWKLRDPLESEDVVQELYLKLWSIRNKLHQYENLDGFAFIMLRNLCYDRIKKSRVMEDLNHYKTKEFENVPGKSIEYVEMRKIIGEIISVLPETQRVILQLRQVEDMPVKEIARQLNMKPNAVSVNLSRARNYIRDQYYKRMYYESKEN